MSQIVIILVICAEETLQLAEKEKLSFHVNDSEEIKGASYLPGLIGCVSEVKINESNAFDITKNILTGICPV